MADIPKELRTERARWDRLARDPYYAVINDEINRDNRLTSDTKAAFAESGVRDVAETLVDIRRWIDPDFHAARAIDFGCGVGRLTIPLARACDHVTGIDISEAMLDEARKNCAEAGVRNTIFATSAQFFAMPPEADATFDLVHAFIVFQHIPPKAGMWLADSLIRRLRPGGVGALHFTYGRRASTLRLVVNRMRRWVPGVNAAVNLVQGRPLSEPLIPMNNYDLAALFSLLGERGCSNVHARFTDHGGHLGAMLIFQKQ
jgi:2-polyprenyl-3-methyl-5-hydroxy-6-metoxy-1,4-benzoquinol methylase